jgi:hypothetical protein
MATIVPHQFSKGKKLRESANQEQEQPNPQLPGMEKRRRTPADTGRILSSLLYDNS